MNRISGYSRCCSALAAGWLVLALFPGCKGSSKPEPLLIGHVADLSGPGKSAGEHAKQGIQLAVEEANSDDNQVAGRPVTVHHADSHGDRDAARSVGVRLATVTRVSALLGGTDPAQEESLGPVAQSSSIPLVLPGGLPGRPANSFVFRSGVAPARQAQVLARFAAEELKVPRVFVLTQAIEDRGHAAQAVSSAQGSAFVRDYRKHGIVAGEAAYKGLPELKDLAPKIRAEKAEAIFLAGTAIDLRELRKAGVDDKLSVLLACEEGGWNVLPAESAPVYVASALAADAETPRAKDFAAKYRDRFGEAPDVQAALAYDSARLLFAAMRQAKSADPVRVKEALADLKEFESVTGPVSLDKDHWAQRPVLVLRLEMGQGKIVKRYEPGDSTDNTEKKK